MCTEAAIKDNVVVVYELLEEMLDNGFPLATESNILKELIKPPTILRTMVNTITGHLFTLKPVSALNNDTDVRYNVYQCACVVLRQHEGSFY